MQLFYCPEIATNQRFLSAEESRHAIKVLRKKEGDSLQIIDGIGGFYTVEITDAKPKKCAFNITNKILRFSPLPYQLHIAIAPTKNNDRLEWFLEKATEIGISEITPILCSHSERKTIKENRLNKVIISAMKQSKQASLPKLNPLTKIADFIALHQNQKKYIAHCENNNSKSFSSLYEKGKASTILIGPEGDFSTEEIKLALNNSYKPISLGKNRLRTETAGIVICNTVNIIES